MKHIVRALILIIILFAVGYNYKYNDAVINIVGVLLLIAFLYLLIAIIDAIRRALIARRSTVVTEQPTRRKLGCSGLLLIILLLALTYVFKEPLGTHSFRVFQFTDNLLHLSSGVSPAVFWGILGLLAGAIYGSFVARKKYKLHGAVNLVPIGILLAFLTILFLINDPLNSTAFTVTNSTQTEYAYHLVTATAYNASQDKNSIYKSAFLLDSSNKTAWITDIKNGAPSEIRFSFQSLQNYRNKHLQFVGFAIRNGYRKSPQLWDNFARAKELTIRYNGSFVTGVSVKDISSDSEEIKIKPIPISSFDNISISINDVYTGAKYPTRVAITELVPIVEYEGD